jgi:hypothetical protein
MTAQKRLALIAAALVLLGLYADFACAASSKEGIQSYMGTPLSRTKKHLWQATADYAAGRWSDAKADLERASGFLEQTLKGAAAAGRDEIQDLYRDIQVLLNGFNQSPKNLGDLIVGVWKRSESLEERSLDYQTAAWEKFQSSSPASVDLIEAKLHVSFGEVYEFTTGENDKARAELEKAESYVKKAESLVSEKTKPKLTALTKEIAAVKAEVGKHRAGQQESYGALEDTLSQLVH